MTAVWGWLLIIVVVVGAAWLHYIVHRDIQGPSHCIGCGKCDKTGICILTGERIGPRRKPKG